MLDRDNTGHLIIIVPFRYINLMKLDLCRISSRSNNICLSWVIRVRRYSALYLVLTTEGRVWVEHDGQDEERC